MNGHPYVFNGGPGLGPSFGRFGPVVFGHGGGGAGHALAWATFALVLLLVLTVWAVLMARVALGPRGWHGPPRMMFRGGRGFDPLAVVKVRYARGEISREEYLQATNDLGGQAEPGGG